MSAKQVYNTANRYEALLGYKRGVRKGPFIFVAGTTALDPAGGAIRHPEDARLQTLAAFDASIEAVKALGGTKTDVCRVRIFVKNTSDVEAVCEAFKTYFGTDANHGSAVVLTILIASFVNEDMLIETEMDALVF